MKAMITTVLIDIDNTLLDFDECAKQSMKKAFEDFGLPMQDNVFEVFTGINNFLWKEIEALRLTKDGLHKVRWQMIFDELGIKESGERFENSFVSHLFDSHSPVAGAHGLLEYLSDKYTVCAASNASYEQQKNRLEKADMLKYMTHMFISEELGFPKPSKEFFDECFRRLDGISKSRVMLIGDSLSADIDSGHAYGIKTCWYNHNRQNPAAGAHADYTVNSLDEIKNIL